MLRVMADEAEFSGALLAGRGRRELNQCKFEAFDELRHERKIKSIDGVARQVVIWISEEGRVRDHER